MDLLCAGDDLTIKPSATPVKATADRPIDSHRARVRVAYDSGTATPGWLDHKKRTMKMPNRWSCRAPTATDNESLEYASAAAGASQLHPVPRRALERSCEISPKWRLSPSREAHLFHGMSVPQQLYSHQLETKL